MFGNKKRLAEAQAQIRAYRDLMAIQAKLIEATRGHLQVYLARESAADASIDARVSVALALHRHQGDDNPVLNAAVALAGARYLTPAQEAALSSLAGSLRDPLADAVDALLG